jgi:hypothetical protein
MNADDLYHLGRMAVERGALEEAVTPVTAQSRHGKGARPVSILQRQ